MKKKFNIFILVATILLIVYSISLLIPIFWALMTSLKSRSDFVENAFGFPTKLEFSNYSLSFSYFFVKVPTVDGTKTVYIEGMLLNSFVYAFGCALVNVFVTCTAAYMVAKYSNWKISKIIVAFVLIAMSLPIIGSLPSELQMAKKLGLYNHIWGLWIMKANFLNVYFLVFYAIFKRIPKAYEEAAKIDGASNFLVYRKIMFPMATGTFFTVLLIKFIEFWNDYQTPLIFMPSKPTLSLGLYLYSVSPENQLSSVPLKLAGCILVMIPTIVLYSIFSEKLIGNVSMGGLKG